MSIFLVIKTKNFELILIKYIHNYIVNYYGNIHILIYYFKIILKLKYQKKKIQNKMILEIIKT